MPKWLPPNPSAHSAMAPRRASPWHAVSIIECDSCCAAARRSGNIRFLSAEAPRLPLATCSKPDLCACAYKHHVDRRVQPRRRDELVGLRRKGYVAQERRRLRGRREDDMH